MPRECPPDKILNPATNKCVKRTGAIGRRLVGCAPDEILNPVTGRCVKRNGTVGRRLLRNMNNPAGGGAVAPAANGNRMTKPELLQLIHELCYNEEDPITMESFEEMTVEQLRTIVRLLDDGGVDFFSKRAQMLPPGVHQKSHCMLLASIKSWLESELRRFPNRMPKHPVTNLPLLRSHVNRIVGRRQQQRVQRQAPVAMIAMDDLRIVYSLYHILATF